MSPLRPVPTRAAVSTLAFTAATLLGISVAAAHASISSGPAPAGRSSKITFSIGHGCEGDDTRKVRVTIPAGVTSVRALRSDFGKPTLIKEDEVVVAVEWEKPAEELLADDEGYYDLTIRARPGDAPFTQFVFDVQQTCESDTGVVTVVDWNIAPGGEGNTAPVLLVVPQRVPGWNKYTVPAAMTDEVIPTFFGDAQIVWRGNAAYSPNALIAAVIATTPGVTPLTGGLAADDEIWVKY